MNQINTLNLKLAVEKKEKTDQVSKIAQELNAEIIRKYKLVDNILMRKKEYFELDTHFKMEIDNHMRRVNKWFIIRLICCDWLKS